MAPPSVPDRHIRPDCWMGSNRLLFMSNCSDWLSSTDKHCHSLHRPLNHSLTLLLACTLQLQHEIHPSPCNKFSPLEGCAVIKMKLCSRTKTLFMASSLSHCHTLHTCLNHFPGKCENKRTLRGQAHWVSLAWWLLAIEFPGRNWLQFVIAS